MRGMAATLVNNLATRMECDRVSLGLMKRNGSIRLRAISHSASFKEHGRLVEAIENAMEEALDQRSSIAFPQLPNTGHAVALAHQALAQSARIVGASVLSVTLANGNGERIGALTFERHRSDPFNKDALQLAEAIGSFLGPVVGLQIRTNKLISGRIADAIADSIAALLGPRKISFKLAVAGLIGLVLFLVFAQGGA